MRRLRWAIRSVLQRVQGLYASQEGQHQTKGEGEVISDRAPELSEKANEILDGHLDGYRNRRKRNIRLRREVVEVLPPKICGCHFCHHLENASTPDVIFTDENEGDDGS